MASANSNLHKAKNVITTKVTIDPYVKNRKETY